MKRISIVILGLLTAFISLAQENTLRDQYPDTLIFEMDNKQEIIFSFDRISRKESYFSSELWQSMLNVMMTAVEKSDKSTGVLVKYQKSIVEEEESVKVTAADLSLSENIFLVERDGIKEKLASRVEFLVLLPQVAISFFINNPEELEAYKTLNIESVWKQIDTKYSNEGKVNLYKGEGSIKYGEALINKIEASNPMPDQLELTLLGIGLGYYRDRFVPDLGSRLNITMHNRLGEEWMEFGVLYTQQHFFERGNEGNLEHNLNGFLTGYWKLHIGSESELGIGVGSLIHRQGDFYQGSTWKLSIIGEQRESNISISPEIVFTNDFNQIFPVLRLGLSF